MICNVSMSYYIIAICGSFCVCGRIMEYFEEMTEKLARNEDLSQPLVVNTQNLAFHGQRVSDLLKHDVPGCM